MFEKLRNRLILINLGVTTLVVLIVFTAIYLFATRSAHNRPPMPEETISIETDSNDFQKVIQISIEQEKQAAAKDLLITLIVAGISIELVVALISFMLAEEAIKPIKKAYEAQKVFIANASHEIKTPLAAISANLEAADIKNNRWISNIEKETAKLTSLNSELLTLARSDLVSERELKEEDLKKIITEAIESITPRLKNKTLTQKIITTKKTKINREDFVSVINILLDNAIKYSEQEIIVEQKDNVLTVKNDGAKVPEDKLPHLFERFYQVDKSSEGVGLGLSIAKSIADRNEWDLTASQTEKYIIFKLTF